MFTFRVQAAPQSIAVAVGGNNLSQLLWNNPDLSLSLWNLAADGQFSLWHDTAEAGYGHTELGPDTGCTAQSLAVGGGSVMRLLRAKSDSTLLLWRDVVGTTGYNHAEFGPFTGGRPAPLVHGERRGPS